jgi:hypothetical protein
MRSIRTVGCAAALGLILSAFGVSAPPANGAPSSEGPTRLDRARHGQDAAAHLGTEGAAVAAKNNMTETALRQLLATDDSLWLDADGRAFYVDPAVGAPTAPTSLPPPPFPYGQTFLLHSRPGSSRTVYLDFDGEQITGTAWNDNTQFGTITPASFFAVAADFDGNPGTFSDFELHVIQNIWQRVSEDYSVFDVDVTTQDPGVAAIDRTDANDQVYGTRALITNTTVIQDQCACSGIAYAGAYDVYTTATTRSHGYYQPALIFQRGLGGLNTNAKYISEAISHEVGHSLGLNHDGTASVSYYPGHAMWAPIMGHSYDRPVTQWSRGEYAGANNTEDDFVTMQAHGLAYRDDDFGNSIAMATPLLLSTPTNGVITKAGDVDFFSVVSVNSGTATVGTTNSEISPNLDIGLELYDSSGTLVATSDPPTTAFNFDVATGMTAGITIPGPGTWYVKVEGVGVGDPLDTGYSAYGSVGQYKIVASALGAADALLRVTTTPAVPSQIIVDDQPRDTWGLAWMKISGGSHRICFRDVPGFATPPCQTVTVTAGTTTVVDGAFTRLGTLRVITSPAVSSTISVDGTPRNDWGVWTDLAAGSHQVCFGAVAGFDPPTCQTVGVATGNTTTVTGTFTSNQSAIGPTGHGTLRVTTSPALPSQVIVDGIARDTWGAWFTIAPGSHQVCFTALEGYSGPPCQTVSVSAGGTTNVTGTFTPRGFLRVITSPAVPGTIIVNGLPRNDWGMWTDLPAGSVQVCFGYSAAGSRVTPACQNAAVVAGSTTTVTGTYTAP